MLEPRSKAYSHGRALQKPPLFHLSPELTELDDWGERTPRSRIVAIGSSMDAQELGTMFDACLEPSE